MDDDGYRGYDHGWASAKQRSCDWGYRIRPEPVSQRCDLHGREDHRDARQWLVNGLFIAFLLTPMLMLGVSLWPTLMQLFGISLELVEPMRPFLRALNWGTLPLLTYFALRRYLQAINVVYPIMFALISANVANAFGDWVLIYGHLGFRAMGITGSGWSTCLSRIYMALVLLITLVYVESKRTMPTWAGAMRIELQRVIALLRLGTPAATQILFEIGAFSAATALCAKLGPVPLSGHEIGKRRSGGSDARWMVCNRAGRGIYGIFGTSVY
ncbi:MAG: hypothetical protein DMG86_19025 [Acidobacteria bacterium]|nr:MAG: hypothetical protein DMG86_19025 [Acidobacteriota bacterium]